MQLPLALAQPHHNRQLFAERFLDVALPQRAEWLELAEESAAALTTVRAILAAYTPSADEAQTEHDLVRPVLNALGHTYAIQPALRTPKGTRTPDYVFYADQAALTANTGRTLSAADLGAAFAVGDANHWERRLDVSSTNDQAAINRVPADQIAFYMRHSGVAWGILTNGRRWRLYHRDSFERRDRYYEVDLSDLAETNDPLAFLYFYAFFRRAAFDPPAAHPLTLAALLRESADYARGVSDALKEQVYDALRHIAQGFLDYPRNKLDQNPATLRTIYANSLIVLYRLLFVLYAEARELLPLRASADYREEYSLYTVVREAARRLDSGMSLLLDTGRTWAKLHDLFAMINVGRPSLNVATFNGGLFDPERHPFLERYVVGDAQLQQALNKLTRVVHSQTGLKEFIDYRDLAECHLGTIYEGLLEYRLVALQAAGPDARGTRHETGTAGAEDADDHPSSVVRRPSSDSPQPSALSPQPSALVAPRTPADAGFTVALVNDKGERHHTGNSYTPDVVVQYLVEQTLQPILAAAVARAGADDAARIAAVLGVNVLDPAMGSGRFLVAAMEYIARYLADLGVAPPAEAAGEPDLAYWKRRVAQSCIYGVDLNPLAVDLAKLSLWLATAARGRPLSFLDHHLRCGNALIGARVSDLDGQPQTANQRRRRTKPAVVGDPSSVVQTSLLDDAAFAGAMSSAVGSMWLIEDSAGANVADVKAQEQLYEHVRRSLTERFAMQADLRTAAAFGKAPEPALWQSLTEYAARRDLGAFAMPAYEPLLQQLRELAAAQRFFHWDLEFPEVFFDRHGRPLGESAGFDAVIGNPPYVRQEQLGPLKPYFQAAFAETYHGMNDLYVYFYRQGVRLLQAGGRMSYIVTNKWLRAGYGEGLRGLFAAHTRIERLVDFGHAPIFPGADVFPCMIIVEKPAGSHSLVQGEGRGDAGASADSREDVVSLQASTRPS